MKKIIYLILPLIIIACNNSKKQSGTILVTPVADTTKVLDTTIIEDGEADAIDPTSRKVKKEKKEKVICGFGMKKLNTRKRNIDEAPGGVRGKPPRKPRPGDDTTNNPPPPDPPPPAGTNVIYLNYFGKTVSGTMWNTNGDFTVTHSGLAQTEMDYVLTQVRAHYPLYNVVITYDQAVFDATPEGHKIEVIVTESWEWFGMAGGVAYIGSFTWLDATPAFVFSSLLNYNGHNIAEAVAHEAGHTLGLRHQSDCVNGVVTNQYSNGPTMGVSYYVPLGSWIIGTSSLQCSIQDDPAKLQAAIGLK